MPSGNASGSGASGGAPGGFSPRSNISKASYARQNSNSKKKKKSKFNIETLRYKFKKLQQPQGSEKGTEIQISKFKYLIKYTQEEIKEKFFKDSDLEMKILFSQLMRSDKIESE